MKNLLTLLACLLCSSAMAATFFIAAGGSDGNNGTSSGTPWKTIPKVNANMAPGNTYLFNQGDTFQIFTTLVLSSNVTVGSYGTGAKPIIQQTNALPLIANTTTNMVVVVTNGGNMVISNLNLQNVWQNTNQADETWWSDLICYNASSTFNCTNIFIHDMQCFGGANAYQFLTTTTNSSFGFNGVIVSNCFASNCTYQGYSAYSLDDGNSFLPRLTQYTNFLITCCTDVWNTGSTLGSSGTPLEIDDADGLIVDHFFTSDCNAQQNNSGGGGGSGGFFQDSRNCILQYSVSTRQHVPLNLHGDGCGFGFDIGTSNCIIQYNTMTNNDGAGLYTFDVRGGGNIARFNIITNNCLIFDSEIRLSGGGTNDLIYGNTVITKSNCVDTTQNTLTTVSNNILITSWPTFVLVVASDSLGNNLLLPTGPGWLNSQLQVGYGSPAYKTAGHIANDGGLDFYGQPLGIYGLNIGAVNSSWGTPVYAPFYMPTNSP